MGTKVCPSEFRIPVEVCIPSTIPNGSGGQKVTFNPSFNAWAKVQLGTRSLQFREDVLKGVKFRTLTMYYDTRLTDECVMNIDGDQWSVQTVDPIDGDQEFMTVTIRLGLGA